MKKLTIVLALLASLSLSAAPLAPGGSISAPIPAGSLITPFSGSTTTSYSGGTLRQAAYQVNATTVDFYYQIVNTGPGSIFALLLSGFAGYGVDVTQSTAAAPASPFVNASAGVQPTFVNRSAGAGNNIVGTYVTPSVGASSVSSILILRVTGATGFTTLVPNQSGMINGVSLSQQLAPTPEPSFYAAVSLGLAGLFLVRRRKSVTAK
jgi:hypothetical protein